MRQRLTSSIKIKNMLVFFGHFKKYINYVPIPITAPYEITVSDS